MFERNQENFFGIFCANIQFFSVHFSFIRLFFFLIWQIKIFLLEYRFFTANLFETLHLLKFYFQLIWVWFAPTADTFCFCSYLCTTPFAPANNSRTNVKTHFPTHLCECGENECVATEWVSVATPSKFEMCGGGFIHFFVYFSSSNFTIFSEISSFLNYWPVSLAFHKRVQKNISNDFCNFYRKIPLRKSSNSDWN